MRTNLALTLYLATAIAGTTGLAASGERTGIAFIQAPEQGGGVCTGTTPDKAFNCAREKCVKSGVPAKDCLPTKWCFPSGWSADVALLHNEGVRWREISCGWPNQTAALEAATIACDTTHRDFIVDCRVVQIYDPQGEPQLN